MLKARTRRNIDVTSKRTFKTVSTQLRKNRKAAFLQSASSDIKSLSNYVRWLKEPIEKLDHLIRNLEKKNLKLKERLIQSTVDLALSNLKRVKSDLNKTVSEFELNIIRSRNHLRAEKSKKPISLKIDTNKAIYLSAKLFGGATKLHEEYKLHPETLPTGIKEIPTVGAIRKRIERYKKNKSKSGRFTKKS